MESLGAGHDEAVIGWKYALQRLMVRQIYVCMNIGTVSMMRLSRHDIFTISDDLVSEIPEEDSSIWLLFCSLESTNSLVICHLQVMIMHLVVSLESVSYTDWITYES